jgi:outer membrane lipase/esterase
MALFSTSTKNSLTGALVALSLTLLAACGGGKQAETFRAQRVVVFGDEASALGKDGRKYTINFVDAAGTLNCAANPLWVQTVAASYGLVFEECNPTQALATGRMRAAYGAKSQDLQTQVDTYLANSTVDKTDLFTIMAGTHDILAQFEAVPRAGEADMLAAMDRAGTLVGDQVLRLNQAGGKVLVATVPDLSLTPLGRQSSAADQLLLNRLSTRLNDKLRVRLDADPNGGGRSGALLPVDENVNRFVINASVAAGFTDAVNPACLAPATAPIASDPAAVATVSTPMPDSSLPASCTTATANPLSGTWLWAGRFQFSAYAHGQLGQLAVLKLQANPL